MSARTPGAPHRLRTISRRRRRDRTKPIGAVAIRRRRRLSSSVSSAGRRSLASGALAFWPPNKSDASVARTSTHSQTQKLQLKPLSSRFRLTLAVVGWSLAVSLVSTASLNRCFTRHCDDGARACLFAIGCRGIFGENISHTGYILRVPVFCVLARKRVGSHSQVTQIIIMAAPRWLVLALLVQCLFVSAALAAAVGQRHQRSHQSPDYSAEMDGNGPPTHGRQPHKHRHHHQQQQNQHQPAFPQLPQAAAQQQQQQATTTRRVLDLTDTAANIDIFREFNLTPSDLINRTRAHQRNSQAAATQRPIGNGGVEQQK